MSGALEGDEREQVVIQIIGEVQRRGDAALFDYTEKFDGVKLTSLEVDKEQIKRAYRDVDSELVAALRLAARRISDFHLRQKDRLLQESIESDLGWLMRPLNRVGINAPGFRAPLPSSLLMTAVPAITYMRTCSLAVRAWKRRLISSNASTIRDTPSRGPGCTSACCPLATASSFPC